MYSIGELFDKRSVVGTRLVEIMSEKKCTKASLCKASGVSRPTLDKVIAGTITNKVNYEKHIKKILEALEITPDMIMGIAKRKHNQTNTIMNILRISNKQISQATGISVQRLKHIESGEEASISEYRDIACCLGTGVRSLIGENFFDTPIATLDIAFQYDVRNMNCNISGFWGHFGIKPCGSNEFIWYPISGDVRKMIIRLMDSDRIVVPCMNNRLLYLNMDNVKEMVLLDDSCDAPDFGNWNHNVSSGEIPMVVYEALEDYFYHEIDPDDDEIKKTMSNKFISFMNRFVKEKQWDESEMENIISGVTTYYVDGQKEMTDIDYNESENISEEIDNVYDFEGDIYEEKNLYYHNLQGAMIIINVNKIAMIELPLVKTEETICENINEMIKELL